MEGAEPLLAQLSRRVGAKLLGASAGTLFYRVGSRSRVRSAEAEPVGN